MPDTHTPGNQNNNNQGQQLEGRKSEQQLKYYKYQQQQEQEKQQELLKRQVLEQQTQLRQQQKRLQELRIQAKQLDHDLNNYFNSIREVKDKQGVLLQEGFGNLHNNNDYVPIIEKFISQMEFLQASCLLPSMAFVGTDVKKVANDLADCKPALEWVLSQRAELLNNIWNAFIKSPLSDTQSKPPQHFVFVPIAKFVTVLEKEEKAIKAKMNELEKNPSLALSMPASNFLEVTTKPVFTRSINEMPDEIIMIILEKILLSDIEEDFQTAMRNIEAFSSVDQTYHNFVEMIQNDIISTTKEDKRIKIAANKILDVIEKLIQVNYVLTADEYTQEVAAQMAESNREVKQKWKNGSPLYLIKKTPEEKTADIKKIQHISAFLNGIGLIKILDNQPDRDSQLAYALLSDDISIVDWPKVWGAFRAEEEKIDAMGAEGSLQGEISQAKNPWPSIRNSLANSSVVCEVRSGYVINSRYIYYNLRKINLSQKIFN
ncbi:MAG: hypothetical protein WBE18_03160, partial [Gammaproteobacteria bacterium]